MDTAYSPGFEEQLAMQNQSMMPPMTPYAGNNNTYQGAIADLTNPELVIGQFEMMLRGEEISPSGSRVQVMKPLVNSEGVKSITLQLNGVVSQISIMSNYEEDNIKNLITYLAETLAHDLMLNRVRYDIKDQSARDKIYFSALSTANAAMRRALENGERQFWRNSQHDMMVRTMIEGSGAANKSKGGIGNLFNLFKK